MQQVSGEGIVRTLSDAQREYRFCIGDDGAIDWRDVAGVPVLDHTWRPAVGRPVDNPADNTALNITLETHEFFDPQSGEKFGFGSSAAITSALTCAFDSLEGKDCGLLDRAVAAHRNLQDGTGSGVDIATCVQGGLIRFERGVNSANAKLSWPGNLHWAVVWTGRGRSTGQQLRKLGTMDEAEPLTRELLRQSGVAAEAWSLGDAAAVIAETRRFTEVLRQFSDARCLGVFSAGHDELQKLANRIGILYKPCGAGGGDIGAAFAEDSSAIASFATEATDAGFQVLDVAPDPRGASIDNGSDDE
jgi:phosphomevalonate kinase